MTVKFIDEPPTWLDRQLKRMGVVRMPVIPEYLEKRFRPAGYFVAGRESTMQAILRTIRERFPKCR